MGILRYLAAVLFALTAFAPAQEKPPRLTFDVASIKPSDPAKRDGTIRPLPGGYGYTSQNIPVKLIVSLMYRVPMRQIKGGPEWLNSTTFDIEAKADKAYSVDDLHTMFQDLLADRFNLKFHMEPKEGPVYALTVEPTGLKMTSNLTPQDFNIPLNQGAGGVFVGKRVPMPYLCWFLGQQLQSDERPVVDKTGLTGNYDFTLLFLPQLPPGVTKDSLPPEVQDRPTVFEALRQQLGLRLQAERGTVQYLVIDSIEKPSDN
jgi:uncharacterized protein (TIGR03435 family)